MPSHSPERLRPNPTLDPEATPRIAVFPAKAQPGWAIKGARTRARRPPLPWSCARWCCCCCCCCFPRRRRPRGPRALPRRATGFAATTSCARWCACAGARAGPARQAIQPLAATVNICDNFPGRRLVGTLHWSLTGSLCPRRPPTSCTTAASPAAPTKTC